MNTFLKVYSGCLIGLCTITVGAIIYNKGRTDAINEQKRILEGVQIGLSVGKKEGSK